MFGLTSALTTTKVSQDNANNVYSARFQDPAHNNPIKRGAYDLYGRPVHPYSLNTVTAGIHSPAVRIAFRNYHAPNYHPFLNAQGVEGDVPVSIPSMAGYDTLGVRMNEAQNLYGEYRVPQTSLSASALVREHNHQRDLNLAMQRRYQVNRFSGGY